MSRKKDIFEKLDYADQRFNELGANIFEGGFQATEVEFLGAMVGEVLASAREVFDYCAKDIVEFYIAPHDTDVASKLSDGNLRCYYPFYKKQLTSKSSVFAKLKILNKPLHNHLFSIAASIEAGIQRPNTLMKYSHLRDMCDMVNEKKHEKLLVVRPSGGETIFSRSPGMDLMIAKEEQVGVSYIQLSPDAKHTVGDTYVFEFNKENVMTFPMLCKNLSRLMMEDFYNEFFV